LSFFIAASNITPLLQKNEIVADSTIQWVPYIDLGKEIVITGPASASRSAWSSSDWMVFIVIMGTIILLLRFFIQYLSYLKIRSRAQLISENGMRLYQVEGDIIPFSFGNSIFINQ